MLADAYIAPFADYVARLRATQGPNYYIPDFDPLDGGVHARVLVLLEAPGPKAVESGFISRNKPDESAKNFFNAFADSDIDRRDTLVWNVIPWYIGSGSKIRPGTSQDRDEAREPVGELFEWLPDLTAVILMGGKAKRAFSKLKYKTDAAVFATLHPSPIVYGTRRTAHSEILAVLREVGRLLDENN